MQCATLCLMTQPYGESFSDALVLEIKGEMGKRNLSSRALGRLIGKSSQYMSDRLDGGSGRTGKRVQLNVVDLAAIAKVLGMNPTELTLRAHQIALGVNRNNEVRNVTYLPSSVYLDDLFREQGLDTAAGTDDTQAEED